MERRRLLTVCLLGTASVSLICFCCPSWSQDRHEVRPKEVKDTSTWNRNGISVGRPKVFDNRTLTIMLEGLSESLRNLQFIDQKSVATALGNFQGSRMTDSSFALSVSGPSLPGVTNEDTVGTSPGQITTKSTDATGASDVCYEERPGRN